MTNHNMLTVLRLIIFLAICSLLVMLYLAWTHEAAAHEWYPSGCCSDKDCEPIDADSIGENANGWDISYCSKTRPGLCINAFVKHGTDKPSQDGGYHICFNSSRIICFFTPQNT